MFESLASFGHFDESESPVIYHYCSTDTFMAIIQNRCLRLSDINTMNDYGELHWAYDQFIQAVNIDLDKYDRKFVEEIDKIFAQLQLNSLPLISCFSQESDLLSQWRAYGDNGTGVALGLNSELLKKLAVRFGKVVYSVDKQVEYFRMLLSETYPVWNIAIDNKDIKHKFREFIFILAFDNCLMKNPAFAEEKEVRLVRATTVEMSENGIWTLSDSEGSSSDAYSSAVQKIRYRTRNGGIVAYIDLPLNGLGEQLVKEVVLGPRSLNSGAEVSMFLTSQGFTDFKIRKSAATYR